MTPDERTRLLKRVGLAVAFAPLATFVGGVVGAFLGSRLPSNGDPIESIANTIAGMTIGCGFLMAVSTYLSTRLDLKKLKRLTASAAIVAIVLLAAVLAWDHQNSGRIFDNRPPAIPIAV